MSTIAAVIGRILLAIIFLVSGTGKLLHVAATEATITGVGLPTGLAIPTGIFEVVAGLCLVFGVMTRLVSILLAGFIALTILFFHSNFTDPAQQIAALTHVAMIGGMLLVFAHSQMWWSWDRMRAQRRGEVAARIAEADAREAQLRSARAEGLAEGARSVPVGDHAVLADRALADRPLTDRPYEDTSPYAAGPVVTDAHGNTVPAPSKRRWF